MTTRNITTDPTNPAAAELDMEGFTDEQIARFLELREVYPYVEFTESSEEWRRLRFLKWRYEH